MIIGKKRSKINAVEAKQIDFTEKMLTARELRKKWACR